MAASAAEGSRINRDLPMTVVLAGSALIVLAVWSLLTFKPLPGAATGAFHNAIAGVLVVVFGFLFVTVSSRICGLIGTSANPVSGMTIATLMATCALFLAAGWTAPAYGALALTIGGMVCIAAANAGATSQDLKTGFLVGATPSYQQLGLFAGVMASSVVIGAHADRDEQRAREVRSRPEPHAARGSDAGRRVVQDEAFAHEGRSYRLLNGSARPSSPRASTCRTRRRGPSRCSGSRASAARTRRPPRPA